MTESYRIPSWQQTAFDQDVKTQLQDISAQNLAHYYIDKQEVALKHPMQDSIVKITDEGYVDLFAGPSLGIRIDPLTNSINIIGDVVNLVGKTVNIKSQPANFIWNGYSFNPELYYENDKEKNQMVAGSKQYLNSKGQWETDPWSIQPMMQYQGKVQYSKGMIAMMQNLGLPVE